MVGLNSLKFISERVRLNMHIMRFDLRLFPPPLTNFNNTHYTISFSKFHKKKQKCHYCKCSFGNLWPYVRKNTHLHYSTSRKSQL